MFLLRNKKINFLGTHLTKALDGVIAYAMIGYRSQYEFLDMILITTLFTFTNILHIY